MTSRRAHHHVQVRSAECADITRESVIGRRIRVDENGCWIYGTPGRYATTKTAFDRSTFTVHRFVYETLVGPIPRGHHLHHKCEVPGCCNPDHLEPLTPKEHKQVHRESDSTESL